ncbi:MAG: integrase [Cellvibrionaceae bacterium]|jgi:integrase
MSALLTASYIKELPLKKNRYMVSDSDVKGLGVMVYPSGGKSFVYRYRLPKCRTTKTVPIGKTDKVSVVDARKSARSMAGGIAKNIDPIALRKDEAKKEKQVAVNADLKLFNYIDKYYAPYARGENKTAKEMISAIKSNFGFIKDKRIDKIDNLDIEKWRTIREKDSITFARIKCVYAYLKACINTAVKHYKLIKHFELEHYSLKRKVTEKVNSPKMRFLSKKEEKNLLTALNNRDQQLRTERKNYIKWHSTRNSNKAQLEPISDEEYPDYITPIVLIAYKTGFDIGDIFDLDWEKHIDLTNNQINKIRNKTETRIDNPQPIIATMTETLKEVLVRWGIQNGKSGRVFKNLKTGKRLNNIKKAWANVLNDAGIKNFRFKDLRHTYGSWLAMNGTDLIDIRDLMGHTDIKTTQIYAHLCPSRKKDAVLATFD